MSRYTLSGFLSPTATPPSFVVPIFSREGSNFGYAQDLDADSRIRRFQPVQPELFHGVEALPPRLSLDPGEEGILAYWMEDEKVVVGTERQLKTALRSAPRHEPFSSLELAHLLGDDEAASAAAREVAALFERERLGRSWRARCLRTGKVLPATPVSVEPTPSENPMLQRLQLNPDLDRWVDLWYEEWARSAQIEQLAETALWWISRSQSRPREQARLLRTLIQKSADARVGPITLKWLEYTDFAIPDWREIWLLSHRKFGGANDTLSRIGLIYLQDDLTRSEYGSLTSHYWPRIWRRLWNQPALKSRLEEIALRAIGQQNASFEMVDRLYHTVLDERETVNDRLLDLVIQGMRAWLPKHLSHKVLWAETYLRMCPYYLPREDFVEIGVNWLGRFGANMNGWFDIWVELRNYLPDDQFVSLGSDWLQRARWDLRAWPKVFDTLAEGSDPETRALLRTLARRWLAWPGSSGKGDRIGDSLRKHGLE